ncbi:MAG: hypothetical protein OXH14_00745, partial [Alphaproteobacteria bacterium]|nr:hypothetical protein [Alphaproteobacteria bacterium]
GPGERTASPGAVRRPRCPTKYGRPAVELVRCERRGGIDFDKLEEDRWRLGLVDAPREEVAAMEAALNDPALSRRVLGLDDEEGA